MTKREVVDALIMLLALPEGQQWVTVADLQKKADELDGNSK